MERNTLSEIQKLQKGDRFYFQSDSKKVSHTIMEIQPNRVLYNRINAYGYKMWQYDRVATIFKQVIFLRHENQ
jgi:Cys-tRNA synthase (O-phospho-L-seryl-tRNA:Cys-tRNA synthase)